MVTRAAKQASGITARLTALGAEVIETPMIETRDVIPAHSAGSGQAPAGISSADFSSLANFDILAFTSTNGVESFFKQLFTAGFDVRVLAGKKIASVGKITEKKLLEYGIRCDYVPEDHTGEGLGKLLRSFLDERTLVNSLQTRDESGVALSGARSAESKDLLDESRILLLQGNLADDTLLNLLPKATRWIVYETLPVTELPDWKREAVAVADAVVFASTSAVENYVKLMPQSTEGATPYPVPHTSFCIGRMTESAARKHGFETVTSDETTMDSLVKKIVEHYKTDS